MSRRDIIDHKLNGLNEAIRITALDDKGAGGAHHEYGIKIPFEEQIIKFQNGPVKENGVNGISQEALIAVCIDRLRCFQVGEYACRENAIALTKLEEAMMWLQKRTRDRLARGVEGTNQI